MKQLFFSRKAFLYLCVAISACVFTGCKENIVISSKIAPSANAVNVYSVNLPVITHTYFDDTAITSTNIAGLPVDAAIGVITDPYFGTMYGSAFFQIIQPTGIDTSFFEPSIDVIDSVALELPYAGFTYGDSTSGSATQTYQVFYMNDTMGFNTTYYSFSNKAINQTFPLSDPYTVHVYSLADSFGTNYLPADAPGIRIPLKLNATVALLYKALTASAATGDPFQNFASAFNGICVRTADARKTNSTAIPYFELEGTPPYYAAGILVYYHPAGTTSDTPTVLSFSFDQTYCAHFNAISKSYGHFPVNNLFRSVQPNDSIIALQSQPGASIDVKIPGVSHLPKGIINKAELQFPVLPGNYNPAIFQGPINIFPTGVGNGTYPAGITSGLTYVVADYFPLSSTTPLNVLDGYPHLMPNGNYVYTIDIPREVMASIQANNDTLHLQINGTQQYYGAFHFVGGGGSYADTTYRPKLFVVYSKLTN